MQPRNRIASDDTGTEVAGEAKEGPKPYIFSDNNPFDLEDYARSILRLRRPEGKIDVVLDTDTFNEVDDQFALAYLLQNSDRLKLKLITAAPFFNHHSASAGDGMNRSFEEIGKVLDLLKQGEKKALVRKGSTSFLKNEHEPLDSPAVRAIIELAEDYSAENPLYIVGIAAATNIASAFLLRPDLKDRVFVVWLGGMGHDWHDNASFNAGQDIAAARVLLASGAPVVQIPGKGILDRFVTTKPELEKWLRGKNKFCDYILDKTEREVRRFNDADCWSRPIFDVVAIAWLLSEEFVMDRLEFSPIMQFDHHYSHDHRRLFIRYVYSVNRDRLYSDLFEKLAKYE